MAAIHQWSVAVRDAKNDAIETTIGTAPTLEIWSGALPANCAAADSGTKIAEGVLPSDYLANSSGGVKSKAGTWTVTGLPAAGSGTLGVHYRLRQGGVVHGQGNFGATGGSGYALEADNPNIANGQVVTVTAASITSGNA